MTESASSFHVERLRRDHDRSAFDSGNPGIDDWFRRIAGQAERRHGTARVFVLIDEATDDPAGFHALVAHGVAFHELPADLRKGQAARQPVPAALIARLAVDRRHQGHGFGASLLRHAVEQVLAADAHLAVPLVVVDAIDEPAASFYAHHGFERFPGSGSRLGARTPDLAAALGA